MTLAVACGSHTAPVMPSEPAFPNLVEPVMGPGLDLPTELFVQYHNAWVRLQSGDLRGADRDYRAVLDRERGFYPAEVGLGDVALVSQQYGEAVTAFEAALSANPTYLPALLGLADANLGRKDDAGAMAALERVVAIDPTRQDAKSRLAVLHLRAFEQEMAAGTKARAAGQLDEARAHDERALQLSPSSPAALRELGAVALAQGQLDEAQSRAQAALRVDPNDAEAYALLSSALDAKGQASPALDAIQHAIRLDPRPEWRARADGLRARAAAEALPAAYRAIPGAATLTRAQVAAYLDTHLQDLIDRTPLAVSPIVTDVQSNWAASWILPVVRAGVMDVQPNHTFQPGAVVRRADLANIVAQVLARVGPRRASDAAAWRAARPRFADVAPDHVAYRAAATAVASGVMTLDAGDRFSPARPITGAELVAAVSRLEELTR